MPEEEEEKKEIKSEREKRKKEKSFAIFVVRKQEARTLYQCSYIRVPRRLRAKRVYYSKEDL